MSSKLNRSDLQEPSRRSHSTVFNEQGKLCFRETYEEPDGRITPWFIFGATKVPVIVMPVTESGEVIVVEQFRYGANRTVLELLGGCIEDDQTAEDAVRTELRQEIGYVSQAVTRLDFGTEGGTWFDPGSSRTRFLSYLATQCAPNSEGPKPEVGEHIRPRLIPLENWFRLLATGEVRDAKSFVVSMLALKHLSNELREAAMKGVGAIASVDSEIRQNRSSDSAASS